MKIFFVAGGTGGHIYPALALAEELEKSVLDVNIFFATGKKPLEKKIFEKTDHTLFFIPMRPFQGSVFKAFLSLVVLPYCFLKSFVILVWKKPQAVIATGGYVSVPFALAAFVLRIPIFLWEANVYPGLSNRVLSVLAEKVFLVFESSKKFIKNKQKEVLGYPLRSQIQNPNYFQKESPEGFRVLVLGGSQGSSLINQAICKWILSEENLGIKLIHQTGEREFEKYQTLYQGNPRVEVAPFFHNIGDVYLRSDVVISRAGAGALYELAFLGKPSILIPLSGLAHDHQVKNAHEFERRKGAFVIEEKNLNSKNLKEKISILKDNFNLRNEMSDKVKEFYKPDARLNIISSILTHLKEFK